MFARFFFRLFLKMFSRRIIRAAYLGILGRAVDQEGLNEYSRELAVRRDLAYILGDLAQSEEARNRLRGLAVDGARPGHRARALPRP
jgi:hypothetical protein